MLQIKTIAILLLSLNLATVAFLGFSYYKHGKVNRQLYTQEEEVPVNGVYSFSEPYIALKLLEKLDVFSVVEEREIPSAYYRGSNRGFKVNFNYCNEHRSRIVQNPEIVFAQKNIISDYWLTNKMRSQIIPKFGAVDLHPEVHPHAKKGQMKYESEMNPDANIFYMLNPLSAGESNKGFSFKLVDRSAVEPLHIETPLKINSLKGNPLMVLLSQIRNIEFES